MYRQTRAATGKARARVAPHKTPTTRLSRGIDASIKATGASTSSTASRLRELPGEILGCIFLECVQSDESPWRLASVCQSWCTIAMVHPRLWAYILITDLRGKGDEWSIPGMPGLVYSLYRYQVCSEVWHLEGAIHRSGNVPLSVRAGGDISPSKMADLLPKLFEAKTAARIEQLDLLLIGEGESDLNMASMLSDSPFTGLRDIIIHPATHTEWAQTLIKHVGETSLNLREAHIDIVLAHPIVRPSFWESLRLLKVHPSLGAEELLDQILPHCKQLDTLSTDWPNASNSSEYLINIRRLSIVGDARELGRIPLPKVEILDIVDTRRLGFEVQEMVEYPKLVDLRVSSVDIAWLAGLRAPALKALSLSTDVDPLNVLRDTAMGLFMFSFVPPFSPQNIYHFFRDVKLPMLDSLTLDSSCSEEDFIFALSSVPNVRSLTFTQREDEKRRFGQKILSRLAKDDKICGNLKELTLECSQCPLSYAKTTLVRGCVAFRRFTGHPLSRLDIWFRKGMKGEPKVIDCTS